MTDKSVHTFTMQSSACTPSGFIRPDIPVYRSMVELMGCWNHYSLAYLELPGQLKRHLVYQTAKGVLVRCREVSWSRETGVLTVEAVDPMPGLDTLLGCAHRKPEQGFSA